MARELLFANLAPAASANALSTALSLARDALSPLGDVASGLLRADRVHIWAHEDIPLDIDLVTHEEALRSALTLEPGGQRDAALCTALAEKGVLLEDEPYVEWALRPREALELLRQRARLMLARDRTKGRGRSQPEAVVEAWEACLAHDRASEDAASSLVRLYTAQGQRQQASSTYERCRTALESLGLLPSPALEEAQRAVGEVAPRSAGARGGAVVPRRLTEERRLVSVLFAELSGVAAADKRRDPEDVRRIVGAALAAVIGEVEGLGGTVTSVSGAGLVAVFGAPEAHEDDPERAVRAGSRMLSAASTGGNAGGTERLSLRVGVETGPAVVGPLGSGATAGYAAVGEVVEAAAALQSAAKVGSVLVGPATRVATEGIFDWGPTEEVLPNPGAKRLDAVYLERPKPRRPGSRGQRGLGRHARLVGREAELSALDEALRVAISGTGSVVFVVGEPGLGKTRLVQECRKRFMAWVGAGTGRLPLWLEGRCASYASSTPYGLYQQLLSAWTGVALEEGDEVVRPALERAMKAVFAGEVEHTAFLAHMMGLRTRAEGVRLAGFSPEGFQRATFASVRAVMTRLAAKGPTVLVLEDLHWADPTSLRLTEELAALAQDTPLLLLATRRPEPDPGVSALETALEASSLCPFRRVELAPLSDEAELELARSIVGDDAGNDVIGALRTNIDGNPLFLEERFSSLVETGALVKDETSWSIDRSVTVDVPEALERLIGSRVDRLAPLPREIIVAASVLGPEFPHSALCAVTEMDEESSAAVGELCASGLLSEVRQLPEPVYRFRHALIQEATYSGLLNSQRRALHARAAWGLETASADRLEEVAAVLGHHFYMAGEADRAVQHFEVAAGHAAAIFAIEEAVSSYCSALEVVDQESGSPTMAKAAIELRYKLAGVLWRSNRFGEAREVLHQALGLIAPDQRLLAARLQARLGRVEVEDHCYNAATAAFDAADELLGDDPEGHDEGWADVWLEVQVDGRANLYYWYNQPERAAAALERARPVAEARGSSSRKASFYEQLSSQRARESRYRIDGVTLAIARTAVQVAEQGVGEHDMAFVLGGLGEFLLWHGDIDEAEENLEAALALGERTHDQQCQTWCLCNLNLCGVRRYDTEAVRSWSPQALAAAMVAKDSFYLGAAKAAMAWVAWREDCPEDVVLLATEALELWATAAVAYHYKGLCLWPLMSVRLASGQLAEAVDAGCQMLQPAQVRLPDDLESVLEIAKAAWDRDEHELAAKQLTEALGLASQLGYA